MRVLQIINTVARLDGGPARNAFELHRSFNESAGIRSVLVALHKTPVQETVAADYVGDFRGGQLNSSVSLLRLVRLLKQTDIVLIHGYYLIWVPFVAAVACLLRKPIALTPHGSLTRYQQGFSKRRKWVFDRTAGVALRKTLSVVAVGSPQEKTELRAKFRKLNIVVVGVGTPQRAGLASSRGKRSSDAEALTMLSISRIAPKKRVDLMIDTLANLTKRGRAARLVVAGTGPYDLIHQLREHAKRLQVSDKVQFVGEVCDAQKARLYESADIFLSPSDDENFGIAVAEALSAGVPCVASPFVASAAGLTPPAGIVTMGQDPAELADAVEHLAREPFDARSLGAQEFAKRHFSWSKVTENWHKVLRNI